MLRRIVQAACDLADAQHGALGVLGADGDTLADFVHVGIDQELADRIGALPHGRGVLGLLINDLDRYGCGASPSTPPSLVSRTTIHR